MLRKQLTKHSSTGLRQGSHSSNISAQFPIPDSREVLEDREAVTTLTQHQLFILPY